MFWHPTREKWCHELIPIKTIPKVKIPNVKNLTHSVTKIEKKRRGKERYIESKRKKRERKIH